MQKKCVLQLVQDKEHLFLPKKKKKKKDKEHLFFF